MANLPRPSTLSEQLNFAVLRIVAANRQTGNAQIGTGYVCIVEFAKGFATHVLVTNKHVVDGASLISFDVHLATEEENVAPDSETAAIDISAGQMPVITHPHCDLVAIVITPAIEAAAATRGRKFFMSPLPLEIFLTNEAALDLDIVEPITMVG